MILLKSTTRKFSRHFHHLFEGSSIFQREHFGYLGSSLLVDDHGEECLSS